MPEHHPRSPEYRRAAHQRNILTASAVVSTFTVTAAAVAFSWGEGPNWALLAGAGVVFLLWVLWMVALYGVSRAFWRAHAARTHRQDREDIRSYTIPGPRKDPTAGEPAVLGTPRPGVIHAPDPTGVPLIRRGTTGTLRAIAAEDIPAGAHMELDITTGMFRRVRPYAEDITKADYVAHPHPDPSTLYYINPDAPRRTP